MRDLSIMSSHRTSCKQTPRFLSMELETLTLKVINYCLLLLSRLNPKKIKNKSAKRGSLPETTQTAVDQKHTLPVALS